VGVAVVDIFTGVYATTAILAALHQRGQTGRGQHIDMSLMDVAVSIMANQSMNYLASGTPPGLMGNAHPNLAPYAVFGCADGWLILAVGNDGQFARLCDVLGLAGLATDARFATNPDRVMNRHALEALIDGATRARSRDDLLATCEAAGVPAGPINRMDDVFADPQVIARGLQIAPEGIPGVRSPMRFSDADLALDRAAPPRPGPAAG
jgi:crotonobetainyl-CoA:carnitine CoA-transferase CaiB-like acyl-CoA transferase